MITHNADHVIEECLKSIQGLWNELLVDDNQSKDETRQIAKRYGAKISTSRNQNLGERKQQLIAKAKGDLILVLDSDERVSKELYHEIKKIKSKKIDGYRIPYQNYVFGKPVHHGGESYSKIRLFRKGKGQISLVPLHEEVLVEGKIGVLNGKIYHHSYRNLGQLFIKFTRYAQIAAQEKRKNGETLSLAKLFLYAPHMFWARYVKEKGNKDGWRGFVLAFAFAYMEGLTHAMLLW